MQLAGTGMPSRRATLLSRCARPFNRKLKNRLGTAANLTSTKQRSELHQLFSVAVAALSPGSNSAQADALITSKPVKEAEKRVLRLEQLLCLRRLYRNIVRAEAYHRTTASVYNPLTEAESAELATIEDRQEERESRRSDALDILADMAVIKEQIQADVKEVLPHCALLFSASDTDISVNGPVAPETVPEPGKTADLANDAATDALPSGQAAEIAALLDSLASKAVSKLVERSERELDLLAEAFEFQPQQKILAREVQARAVQMGSGLSVGASTSSKYLKGSRPSRAPVAAARDFVKQSGVKAALRASRSYVTDFWARINGLRPSAATESMPFGLPIPFGQAGVIWPRVQALQERISDLEKHLKESSKAREQRVRRAPLELRATMAYEMQDMDRDVLRVGRELALCTLDVQLDALYLTLEEEVRQFLDVEAGAEISGKEPAAELAQMAQRRGSTEELSVLIAQYSLLVRRQASLRDVFQRQEQSLALLMPAFDEEVRALAGQISESRLRVGIPDQDVFGGSGFSMRKLQLQLRDASVSVRDGVDFFVLGVRMLITDVGYSGRLFGRATFGVTLKAREVSALRRTLKDILTFVPFIIILIIPMTPLGHVLVFGFIQRYFPDFFPSQFNQRRQEMVKTYEELRQRLQVAQAAANHEEDQENLQQAAAAVARLTPPSVPVVLDQVQEPAGDRIMSVIPNGGTTTPEQVKELRRRVKQAGFEAMNFGSESEDEPTTDPKQNPFPGSRTR